MFIYPCGISRQARAVASPLTASGIKGSLLLIVLLLIFSAFFYHRLFVKKPSIIDHFEQRSFHLNFQIFKSAILHAHLYFRTHEIQGCKVDCWIKSSVGLDFNSRGYPISTRYSPQNAAFDPLISEISSNSSDCAQIWVFLMGPLHNNINTDKGHYLARFQQPNKSCVYHFKKRPESSIIYRSDQGTVKLLSPYNKE